MPITIFKTTNRQILNTITELLLGCPMISMPESWCLLRVIFVSCSFLHCPSCIIVHHLFVFRNSCVRDGRYLKKLTTNLFRNSCKYQCFIVFLVFPRGRCNLLFFWICNSFPRGSCNLYFFEYAILIGIV
jgi:hypothetical protein